jgi:hypothetical protein
MMDVSMIVIGGGSPGCVVAARLSEDPRQYQPYRDYDWRATFRLPS